MGVMVVNRGHYQTRQVSQYLDNVCNLLSPHSSKLDKINVLHRLVVVCIADRWDPIDLHTANTLHSIQKSRLLPFIQIYDVDRLTSEDAISMFQVVSTPAVLFFYDRRLMRIKRPSFEQSDYCKITVGQISCC
jgi:hypothetical protein